MRALAKFVLVGAGLMMAHSAASAADLDHYSGKYGLVPQYYGLAEPWSETRERPPRKGLWYFTGPDSPTVNFLVPMKGWGVTVQPWTPEWVSYCSARWPSFNPRTGTVLTPDGVRMCF